MPPLLTVRPSPVTLILAKDAGPTRRPRAVPGLVRVRHGVYAPARDWDALTAWHRYLARVHAVALARPGTLFCLESAAALLGLPIFGEPRDIHVLGSPQRKSNRFADVVVHSRRDHRDVVDAGVMAMTSIAHTATDLIRALPPAFGLAVADAAVSPRQRGACTTAELTAITEDQIDRRGTRRLDWVLARADARAESAGEAVSRAVIEWLGYPAPVLQREFTFEGVTDRPDMHWEDEDAIGESDGYGKYDASDPVAMKRHFVAEKLREDRLRRHIRGFARWDWGDAMRATPLDAKLRAAGLARVRPIEHAMLATLRDNPRSLPAPVRRETRRSA